MPQVSVVMPFHLVTPFLRPAIRSILQQTWQDLELLLVDNGTGLPVEQLGEEGRDPRLIIMRFERNVGIALAHNAALARAKGEFIANMDSDDLARPERLRRQVEALRADPRLGLVATHARTIDGEGRAIGEQFTIGPHAEQEIFSRYTMPVTNPSLMGRRKAFEQHLMRPEFSHSSDYDFLARAIETWRCDCLPEMLLDYRVHGGQVTQSEHPSMVFNASLIRILTARRRAGRPERKDELVSEMQEAHRNVPPIPQIYAMFAERALAEGFGLLAVFFARRAVGNGSGVGRLARGLRILTAAVRQNPREAGLLFRMFSTGPVRAHGLRPLRASDAGRADD